MKSKRLWIGLNMVLMAMMMVLVLFSAASAQTTTATKTLKVGCTLPLNVAMGLETKKCLEILVDEFNKAGGMTIKGQQYLVQMIIYDDKYKADTGRAAVEKLIYEDKVSFMVNQLGSAPVLGGLPVAEENKIMTFPYAVSDKIIDPQNKYSFRLSGLSGTNFAYIIKAFPNTKSMVALAIDDETGKWNASAQGNVAKAVGMTVYDPIYYPRDTQDFAPFATKIKNLNPDMVSTWGGLPGTQLGLIFNALYKAGWKGVKTHSILNLDEILSVCPKEAVEGLMCSYGDPTELPRPSESAMKLKQIYTSKYGKWDYTGSTVCNPWEIFISVLKTANSLDNSDIMSAIPKVHFTATDCRGIFIKRPDLGNTRYCDILRDSCVGVVKDGKMTWPGVVSLDVTKVFIEQVYGRKGEWGY